MFLNDCILYFIGHNSYPPWDSTITWGSMDDNISMKQYSSLAFGIATDLTIILIVKSQFFTSNKQSDLLDD